MKETLQLFQNKTYAKLVGATFASQIGSNIGVTAFMLYVLKKFSEQPYWATLTELMYAIPILCVFFLVGVFADRFDRQKIAYYSDAICLVISLLLLVAVQTDWMPLMLILLFMRKAVASFFQPAEMSLVQGILKKEEYVLSAGINQMMYSLMGIFGKGMGVFIYWAIDIEGAIIIDAISFLVSFILIRSCVFSKEVRLPNGEHSFKDLKVKKILGDYMDGLRYVHRFKLLFALLMGYLVFGIVNASYSVLPIFLLKYKFVPDDYEAWAVWEGVSIGLGILLGVLLIGKIVKKTKPYQLLMFGLMATGILTICIANAMNPYIMIIALFFSSLVLPAVNMGINGWLQTLIDPRYRGRFQGCIQPIVTISQVSTLTAISFLFPTFAKAELLFTVTGCCMLGLALIYALRLPKLAKEHERKLNEEKESLAS